MDLQTVEPVRLAHVLDLLDQDEPLWREDDLGAVLAHQLRAPLVFDTMMLSASTAERARAEECLPQVACLADLLRHPRPSMALLQMAKAFCKQATQSRDSGLAKEVAQVLYYAVIVTAKLRRNQRITALTDEQLLWGVQWALRQPWLDALTRSVLKEGERSLR